MARLKDGLEIIGKINNSGYKHDAYLIKTHEDTYIELSELLYQTIIAMQSFSSEEQIAHQLSHFYDKEIDTHAVRFLIDTKLKPLGIIAEQKVHPDKDIASERKNHNHNQFQSALRFKFTLVPQNLTGKIARFLSPIMATPVMICVVIDFILLNVWLFGFHGVYGSLQESFQQPFTFLLIIILILLATLFHEFGHAAGCAYGGAKPGRIGAGLYFIWPAFFTDISDIYRLNRAGKLRSDIGGIYFNFIFALIVAAIYFVTGYEPLLLVITLQNLSIFNQLLPFIRLDGYYIVSDIVGLPDLFARIKPILANVILRRNHPAATKLKLWVKVVVTLWIAVTIPAMVFLVLFMLINSPRFFYMGWVSAISHMMMMMQNYTVGNYLLVGVQFIQLFILLLPVLGIGMLFYSIAKQIIALNEKLKYQEKPHTHIYSG